MMYKAKVKNGVGWRNYRNIRLQISVGQPYHNGKKFAAVIDLINRNRHIESVQICVNDELQRWNLLANHVAKEEACQISLKAGQAWITEHQAAIQAIHSPSFTIVRWGEWTNTQRFKKALNELKDFLKSQEGAELAGFIHEDGKAILTRRKKRESIYNEELFLACSESFIIEEIAGMAVQQDEMTTVDLYPGSKLQSMQWISSIDSPIPASLKPLKQRLLCRVDFVRRRQKQKISPHATRSHFFTHGLISGHTG